MRTPIISFHGGKCCAIKHIYNFAESPTDKAEALEPEDRNTMEENADQYGRHVSSKTNFYNEKAPAETWLERIDRYLAFLDIVRPNGIVEVALADNTCTGDDDPRHKYDDECFCCHDDDQTPVWRDLLEARGFVEVTNCHNSNSNNRVYIFHRKTDKE